VSEANHNLILWLDKPGMEAGSIYKQISFLNSEEVETRNWRVFFLGRARSPSLKETKMKWCLCHNSVEISFEEAHIRF